TRVSSMVATMTLMRSASLRARGLSFIGPPDRRRERRTARRRGGWWGTWRRAPGPPLDVREHPRPVRGRGGPRVLARRGTPGSSCSPPPPGRGRASWRAPGRSRSDAGLLLHLVGGDEVLELQ